jgi:5'-nucleotidase/UDP-sugar diphosphatase
LSWSSKLVTVKRGCFTLFMSLLLLLLAACTQDAPKQPLDITSFTVLYTNDEHGWMQGMQDGQGAANLLNLWRRQEGYTQDGSFVMLSGGDNWTGPAISTWFEGESMVEVMNTMGYDASVIGNHEFDFGLPALQERLDEADFPYLSANLRYTNGNIPEDLGIQPYTILEVDGLRLGVIGLTTTSTPRTTNPVNITQFKFIDYVQALRQVVPQVRKQGVDLLLVPAHICVDELTRLAVDVRDLDINLLGGGHCNESFAQTNGDLAIISGGYHFRSYAFVRYTYDPNTHTILDIEAGVRENRGALADPAVAAVVNRWQAAADAELNTPIGYLRNEVPRRSQAMQDLITESWLFSYPQADIALTNQGGIRNRLPAGELTLAQIINVMPFDNVLVETHLSGKELLQVVQSASPQPAIGGMHQSGQRWVLDGSGEAIEAERIYSVLVNDFMYAGGDDYARLQSYDPKAYNTAIDWRQPLIDWILAQGSSYKHPLDEMIANLAD